MVDTPANYTAQALRTESPITPALQTRLQQQARLLHAVLGLQTEAGELADPVKKHIYYGRPLDLVNLREEIGDCLWYLAIAADALGTTLEAEQARNLAKLRARYPHVFTAEAAQVRNLDRERQVLEGVEVETLRQQLAAARAETVEVRRQLNEETDRHRATNAEKIELFQQKEWANKHAAELVAERDAALAAVTMQRAGIERLNKVVAAVRSQCIYFEGSPNWRTIDDALAELDGEPAPATELDEDDIIDRVDGDALAAGITEVVREIVEGRKAKAGGNSSVTLTGSPEPEGGQ